MTAWLLPKSGLALNPKKDFQKYAGNHVTVKNRIRNQVAFMALHKHYGGTPSKYNADYLENFAFFSSNACLFYHQTDVGKYDCPTGKFLCEDSAGTMPTCDSLTYAEAVNYCNQRNSSLSKYSHTLHFIISKISASFDSFKEFSLYAKNMSDAVIWTDYERINETHFWSPSKKVFIRPKDDPEFGNRKSF